MKNNLVVNIQKYLKQLCIPSFVYFAVSMIAILISIVENIGNKKCWKMGAFSCAVNNTSLLFIVQLLYIFLWTWILDLICKSGYTNISWFLVLLPWILIFSIILLIMLKNK